MIKSSIEKLASEIGFEIGISDDETQAKLLNSFCNGLHDSILNESDKALQICAIVNKLTDKSCNIIEELYEFIKLKRDN